jgi:ABC-type transport system involved in cytochrome bd biosynthesis fused ATPase/permease subunit
VSGGQARRIALARALLAGFSFLIADEPTEGLDTTTAGAVMETLFSAARSSGLIIITHRPDLCPDANAVYNLCNGRLVRLDQ